MILYVLGHAESVAVADDLPEEWRYLAQDEVKSLGKTMEKMAGYCRMPRLIIGSPFVRSVQTAQIVASQAGRKSKVMVSALLLNGGSLSDLRDVLFAHAAEKRVMVVGPQAQLQALVGSLFAEEEAGLLAKDGCLALEINPDEPEQPAGFLFYLAPGKKTLVSLKKALAAVRTISDREPACLNPEDEE